MVDDWMVKASEEVPAIKKVVPASKRVPASKKVRVIECKKCHSFFPYNKKYESCALKCPRCESNEFYGI